MVGEIDRCILDPTKIAYCEASDFDVTPAQAMISRAGYEIGLKSNGGRPDFKRLSVLRTGCAQRPSQLTDIPSVDFFAECGRSLVPHIRSGLKVCLIGHFLRLLFCTLLGTVDMLCFQHQNVRK